MKIDYDSLKDTYLQLLKGKVDSRTFKISAETLEDTLNEINSRAETVIEELVSDPRYVHYIEGQIGNSGYAAGFGFRGHIEGKPKGDLSYHPDIKRPKSVIKKRDEVWTYDELYENLDKNFEAVVFGNKVGSSYVFQMLFPDNTFDHRAGAHTIYALLIPKDKIADKVPKINQNPEILIKAFRNLFPKADQRKGKLKIVKEDIKGE